MICLRVHQVGTIFLSLASCWLVAAATLKAAEPPASAKPDAATPAGASDPVARELLDLRRAIGGSILEGSAFAPVGGGADRTKAPASDEKSFVENIQKLARLPRQMVSDAGATTPKPATQGGEPISADQQASLRVSARGLDHLAADLEDAGLYDQADRMRLLAGELRRSARTTVAVDSPFSR